VYWGPTSLRWDTDFLFRVALFLMLPRIGQAAGRIDVGREDKAARTGPL
jgi:hypothetical protein